MPDNIQTATQSLQDTRAAAEEKARELHANAGLTYDENAQLIQMTEKEMAEQFKDDDGKISPERAAKHNKLFGEWSDLKCKVNMLQQSLLAYNPSVADPIANQLGENMKIKHDKFEMQERDRSFREFMRLGINNPNPIDAMEQATRDMIFEAVQDKGTPAEGGHLLVPSIANEIVNTLGAYGGIHLMAQLLSTGHGRQIFYPGNKGHADKGALVNEGADAGKQANDDFYRISLDAYKYTSKLIIITHELIADANVSILPWVMAQIIRRIGRIECEHLTTGDGSSKPQGGVSGAPSGVTAASATVFTPKELITLMGTVDAGYLEPVMQNAGGLYGENMKRIAGKTGWLMSRAMELALYGLADSQSRPLWLPSIRDGSQGMLFGYPYAVSFEMDGIATGKKPIAFGNWGYFTIRNVGAVRVLKQIDALIPSDSQGYVAFHRCDSDWRIPTNETQFPVKVLTMG